MEATNRGNIMRIISRTGLIGAAMALVLAHGARAQDDSAAYVVAYIEVSPSSIQQAADLIAAEAEASRNDPGNLLFEPLQRIGRPESLRST